MNPQDENQNPVVPEDTLGGTGNSPVLESPSTPQEISTPTTDEAALHEIDALEAEPVVAQGTPETAPSPIETQSISSSWQPITVPTQDTTPQATSVEASTAGVAAAAGVQATQNPSIPATSLSSEKKPSSKKGIIIILVIVIALAAGVAGYFVYQSLSSSGASDTTETTTIEEETGGDAPGGDDVPTEDIVNN